jgi:hypothetical protein
MKDITAICVCSNTVSLIRDVTASFRQFHPDMKFIIVDGSDKFDACYFFAQKLQDKNTEVVSCGQNIGHGRGMDLGIKKVKTKYALIFDSDILFLKSPVAEMLSMMNEDTYGIGHTCIYNGVKYLSPVFQLINVAHYLQLPPYVHHGVPCIKTMEELHRRGLNNTILDFPIFPNYILHKGSMTRKDRKSKGKKEIEGGWVK